MPGIDELLRTEGERWRTEIDTHYAAVHDTTYDAMPDALPDAVPDDAHEVSAAPRLAARRPAARRRVARRTWVLAGSGLAAAAVAVLAVGLAGSSGNSGSAGGSSADSGTEFASRPKAPAAAASAAAGGVAAPGVAQAPSTAPSAGGAPVSSAALVLTGSLEVTVTGNSRVDTAAARAAGIATAAGGRVDGDTRSTDGQHSAVLVLRVPNAAIPGVTRQLSALGKVSSRELQTRDVTTRVADVNSRVASARAAIAALTRLYARADTVPELIAVETALSARQADLEALESEQRTLSAQTSLATLTVSIDVRTAATHHTHHNGFVAGLTSGWHAFTHALRVLVTGIGAALPFLVLALLIGAAAVLARRRRRRPVPSED